MLRSLGRVVAATLAGVVIGLVVGYIPSLLVYGLVAGATQGTISQTGAGPRPVRSAASSGSVRLDSRSGSCSNGRCHRAPAASGGSSLLARCGQQPTSSTSSDADSLATSI
jgi:hypothetical protein